LLPQGVSVSTPAWLDRRMTIACTVYTRVSAGTDEYGNVLYAEVATDTKCFIQPASQLEIQDGRAEYGDYMLHLPASMAGQVDGFARVEVNGVSFEVSGPAAV